MAKHVPKDRVITRIQKSPFTIRPEVSLQSISYGNNDSTERSKDSEVKQLMFRQAKQPYNGTIPIKNENSGQGNQNKDYGLRPHVSPTLINKNH